MKITSWHRFLFS